MNAKNIKVDLTCPECGMTSLASIGRLESGHATCPHCKYEVTFDSAQATALRDDIEAKLERLQATLDRLKAK